MPTFLIIILLLGLFLVLVVILFALFIPNKWDLEEQVTLNAMPEMLFPLFNRPSNWAKWSIWSPEFDESIETESGEIQEGLGAVQSWTSDQMNGILSITQSTEDRSIQFHLALDNHRHIFHAQIALLPLGEQTSVTWTTKYIEEGINPLKRLQSSTLRKLMRYNMQTSLENLQKRYG